MIKLNKSLSAAMMGLLLMAACKTGTGVAQSSAGIQNLEVDSFEAKMNHTAKKIILDVRTPGEFENGHIENAVNMNVNGEDFETQVSKLDTNTPVFVYCLAGSRSAKAAAILQDMGFKNIYNLEGGISAWNGNGKPITKNVASAGIAKTDYLKMVNHGDTLVLVDFYATWCAPCKKIEAYIGDLKKEYAGKLVVIRVDYDANLDLTKELKINSVPFLLIYKKGEEKWRHSGFAEKVEVKKELDKI